MKANLSRVCTQSGHASTEESSSAIAMDMDKAVTGEHSTMSYMACRGHEPEDTLRTQHGGNTERVWSQCGCYVWSIGTRQRCSGQGKASFQARLGTPTPRNVGPHLPVPQRSGEQEHGNQGNQEEQSWPPFCSILKNDVRRIMNWNEEYSLFSRGQHSLRCKSIQLPGAPTIVRSQTYAGWLQKSI